MYLYQTCPSWVGDDMALTTSQSPSQKCLVVEATTIIKLIKILRSYPFRIYLCSHVMYRKMNKNYYAVKWQIIFQATTICVQKGEMKKWLEYSLMCWIPYYSFYQPVTCTNCVLYSLHTNHFYFQFCSYSNVYELRRFCLILQVLYYALWRYTNMTHIFYNL